MSTADLRAASDESRLLVRILAGMAERRLEAVISPPTGSFPSWSATVRPGGQVIGKDGVWSARTEIAGWEMDYQIEADELPVLLEELVSQTGVVGSAPLGGFPAGARALEELLGSLQGAGRQIILCPPLDECAARDQGLTDLIAMIATQTTEYLP